MKFTGLLVASFASLILVTSTAFASQVGYECEADGKSITLAYSYSSGFLPEVDMLTIDGQDFTHSSKVRVFRGSGTVFTVANYRAGKSMYFGINTPSGTYYQLEGGAQYPMTCKAFPQPAAPAADDRL